MEKETMSRLLAIPEVAQLLGLSTHTIRAWVQKGRIEHHKLGRRVLISPAALERILAETERPRITAEKQS